MSETTSSKKPERVDDAGARSQAADARIASQHPSAEPVAGGVAQALLQRKLSRRLQRRDAAMEDAVQLRGAGGLEAPAAHDAASRGVEGATGSLPHLDAIRESFGAHDVGGIKAQVGGPARDAADSLGAAAYATGDRVAFRDAPDLHTAAHEAAHVVQQRSGVQLKGGVGEAGDVHEQHADAVADLVTQGKSAAPLLDRYASVEGTRETAGVQRKPGDPQVDDQKLEDLLQAVAGAYKYLCFKQRDAVEDLKKDAEQKDPPPLWQTLLLAGVDVALAFALGGVGGIVASAVLKKLVASGAAEATAKVVADAMKDAAKETAKQIGKGVVGAVSSTSTDPREIFFRGQRDILTDTAFKQESDFTTRQKAVIRKSANPIQQATALMSAMEANYQAAYDKQRDESLDAWCVYMAKSALNKDKDKDPKAETNLGPQIGDTSGKGVLGIVIRAVVPGAVPKIERAEIEGLNAGMRAKIENRPLKNLRMPITVKGEVFEDIGWAAKYLEKRSQPSIAIGRNEAGTVWVDTSRYQGISWLHLRAHPYAELWATGASHLKHDQEAALTGARLVIENDMKDLTVQGKLSG